MKVLVDNYTTARTTICPGCNSVLEVTVKDLRTWHVTTEELLKKRKAEE